MYWSSPLVAKAVSLGLVDPRPLGRLARRVQRRAGDLPSCDLIWAEELVRSRHLTRYQAAILIAASHTNETQCDARSNQADSPLKIGNYMVLDCVGRSDLGATYRCARPGSRDFAAIKLLEPHWASSAEGRARVIDELGAWESLNDARVVRAECVETESGSLALVSRWVDGVTPADWLRAGRRSSPDAALAFVRELVAVLAGADAQGRIHGDLKPSNVLITRRGEVRLVDSGLRRAVAGAQTHENRHLPPQQYDYVAPEIAAGSALPDAASDIYSIGCLLYHVVTGRPPFFGGNAERKCAAHRAGRPIDPRLLGFELGHELRLMLESTIQADRTRRACSYNELLNRLSPSASRGTGRTRRELRRMGLGAATVAERGSVPSENLGVRRWGKWLLWASAAAVTAVAVTHGSARLMPLVSLRASTRSQTLASGPAADSSARTHRLDRTGVTALWNATEELRLAYRDAEPHDTITLNSPGPFLLDAIRINKPITLRGAEDVRPIFLGGPGAGMLIAASDVRLENLHFLRVNQTVPGQSNHGSVAMIEAHGDRSVIANCSFQVVDPELAPTHAVSWRLDSGDSEASPATLDVRNVWFRNVKSAVARAGNGGSQLTFDNCLHLGTGPLVGSASGMAKPFEGADVTLSHVTVYGAGVMEHSFPHPFDDVVPLRIVARDCYLVPRTREQPVLAVRYAAQPAMLMPKVSWSGSGTVCPADATLLEVTRGPDATPWRASDVAAWQKYWGTHSTGILGARIPFATGSPSNPTVVPAPTGFSKLGADSSRLSYPPAVALDQLPLLIERLQSSK
jgi:serine/threonine-protein kinase